MPKVRKVRTIPLNARPLTGSHKSRPRYSRAVQSATGHPLQTSRGQRKKVVGISFEPGSSGLFQAGGGTDGTTVPETNRFVSAGLHEEGQKADDEVGGIACNELLQREQMPQRPPSTNRVIGRLSYDLRSAGLVVARGSEGGRPPGLEATNNISERAIRALIGARKNWGGNRTPRGARAQAVLTSILQTAKQQGKKTFDVLVELLCGSDPHEVLDLVPVNPEAPRGSPHPPPSLAVPDILATLAKGKSKSGAGGLACT